MGYMCICYIYKAYIAIASQSDLCVNGLLYDERLESELTYGSKLSRPSPSLAIQVEKI